MRTSSRLAAGLLMAVCCTVAAHAQSAAASAAAPSSAPVQDAAQAPAPAGLSPAQRKAADRKLQRRVGTALARTRNLNATRILVRVRDGNVTLAGSVTDTTQANLATTVVRGVDGVASVSNLLRIDGQQP